ncbi:MAG TPA: S41 family peptidase, partial [Bacilli bacterium]|nr:S41 family peptidase [Bacilli bacterium]
MLIRGRYLALSLVVTVALSSGVTAFVMKNTNNTVAGAPADFTKLNQVYQALQQNYYQDVDSKKLVNGAIDGMVKALDDPYSSYMDEQDAAAFTETIESKFEGIGAEISEEDGNIVVVSPIKGSPAEEAGIKPNDKILSVNGTLLSGMNVSEAVKYIRGEKGSKAELVVRRAGETTDRHITIVRDEIPLETVSSEMLEDGMGKIAITRFSASTAEEFEKALSGLQSQGMKGLILDLRQNPGGLLDQAVEIGNKLIPDNKLILQVQYRDGTKEVYRSKHEGASDFPIVALVDGGSASAAEIMAGALKESGDFPLVGEKTFGKGTVQTVKDFTDKSNVKYTIAKWLTPDGNWIHKKGIEPDYKVELPSYASLPYIDPAQELKPDTFSNEIKSAEEMLVAIGYNPGAVDGFFDEKTEIAVRAFQRMEGFEANGVITGKTTEKLMDRVSDKIKKNDTQLDKA